jgi:hypothetical protein
MKAKFFDKHGIIYLEKMPDANTSVVVKAEEEDMFKYPQDWLAYHNAGGLRFKYEPPLSLWGKIKKALR